MIRTRTAAFWALCAASILYGSTFVVVKQAITILPPLSFVGWRFLVGAAALLLIRLPRGVAIWRDGLAAGIFLFSGYALQTQGLITTSASNSALITGLYVVLTPFFAALLARTALRPWMAAGGGLAFLGLVLLTRSPVSTAGAESVMTFRMGDLLTVGAAASFAVHIALLGRLARRHPVVAFTGIQLAVTGALGLATSAALEGARLPPAAALAAVIGTGLGVSAGAYFLQIWAQTIMGPSRTAVILALEPVFGALTAAVVLNERLSVRGGVGALLILVAIFVVLGKEDAVETKAESISAAH